MKLISEIYVAATRGAALRPTRDVHDIPGRGPGLSGRPPQSPRPHEKENVRCTKTNWNSSAPRSARDAKPFRRAISRRFTPSPAAARLRPCTPSPTCCRVRPRAYPLRPFRPMNLCTIPRAGWTSTPWSSSIPRAARRPRPSGRPRLLRRPARRLHHGHRFAHRARGGLPDLVL